MKTKKCSRCGEEVALTEYFKCKKHKDGLQSECKKCHTMQCKDWADNNVERCRDNNREWKRRNTDKVAAQWSRWAEKNRDKLREDGLRQARELEDVYVKNQLHKRGWRKEDITPEIIEVKRLEILIKRHIRNGGEKKDFKSPHSL